METETDAAMVFTAKEWNYTISKLIKNDRIPPTPKKAGLKSMKVACECGNSWFAVKGTKKGDIPKGLSGKIQCPRCDKFGLLPR